VKLSRGADGAWVTKAQGTLKVDKKHQLANYADFCNECGNCDIFCPEDGGPYKIKPRFFGTLADFEEYKTHDGFFLERQGDAQVIHGRFELRAYSRRVEDGRVRYAGDGFSVSFDERDPLGTLEGDADREIDLAYCHILGWLQDAVYASSAINYLTVTG
jgi:putative selenate reductase